ncbi:ABC-three component system middle component 6 [Leptospira kanakyensis]|uniref:Acetylserotonin O-methyltransferase dimerisation domain-containing protein n=1 Tax=Leptospira kanakyensis TaxID=2484968 RepID=A0A6N4Q4V2_9LEPT|nr:ABC-three component system middle component 6 [Leptospira kanakyensis]MCW7480268.1 hypothetical protein [Leptospira kanakyensis]TGK50462.1 hypothetical protein EHQ11_12315 [Leptospira kanakyensis]TGK63937.1 hypothetical protein EHQ16_05705 [Leptospira kanakyensis]TGK69600.1 hypothetical protein EHQ18_12475 [Leptospira kanakyensis]
MLINKETNPERDLYFLGAKVIQAVSGKKGDEFSFLDILQIVNEEIVISPNLLALTLNWLYILGTIELTENGNIKKCF